MIIMLLVLVSYVVIGSAVGHIVLTYEKRKKSYDAETMAIFGGAFWPFTLLLALGVFIGQFLLKKNDKDSKYY